MLSFVGEKIGILFGFFKVLIKKQKKKQIMKIYRNKTTVGIFLFYSLQIRVFVMTLSYK
jgi:hypothetical protein